MISHEKYVRKIYKDVNTLFEKLYTVFTKNLESSK